MLFCPSPVFVDDLHPVLSRVGLHAALLAALGRFNSGALSSETTSKITCQWHANDLSYLIFIQLSQCEHWHIRWLMVTMKILNELNLSESNTIFQDSRSRFDNSLWRRSIPTQICGRTTCYICYLLTSIVLHCEASESPSFCPHILWPNDWRRVGEGDIACFFR